MEDADLQAVLQRLSDAVASLGELATQLNAAIETAKAAVDEFRTKIESA